MARALVARTPLISLYSGAGGLDLGFAMAGFAPIFANDIDPSAEKNYRAVMASANVWLDSGHYVTADLSRQLSTLRRNEESVLVGGPPCQGFSRAGRMDPRDPRSQHIHRFMEAVQSIRPRAFVMENVRALASSTKWRAALDEVRMSAERSGYKTRLTVLNAKDFGVAQSRERMFLVGVERGEGMSLDILNDQRSVSGPPRSVRDALGEIDDWATQPDWQKSRARIVPATSPVLRRSPFAGMMFNGQGRPLDLDAPAPTMSASLGGNHTPIIDQEWLVEPSVGGRSIRQYHEDLLHGLRPKVPTSWRRMTLLEAAEVQSFPRGVEWDNRPSVTLRHIGNAVPPLLGAEVAKRLASILRIN